MENKTLTLLVGPPGAGKSTLANQLLILESIYNKVSAVRINRDEQGNNHFKLFDQAIAEGKTVIVDKMNFNVEKRKEFLDKAKINGYKTKIIVIHESYETCIDRCINRKDHQTIKTEKDAKKAVNFFFSHYEPVRDEEADKVIRIWPEGYKPKATICDLDGTLCDVEHRRHFVRGEGKKDWKSFFEALKDDPVNEWCADILHSMKDKYPIVYVSGRSDGYKALTLEWLNRNGLYIHDNIFMRNRSDFRQDDIVKEIILDFELLTRYDIHFIIDDRKQVVDMFRRRGFTVLQCADGNF